MNKVCARVFTRVNGVAQSSSVHTSSTFGWILVRAIPILDPRRAGMIVPSLIRARGSNSYRARPSWVIAMGNPCPEFSVPSRRSDSEGRSGLPGDRKILYPPATIVRAVTGARVASTVAAAVGVASCLSRSRKLRFQLARTLSGNSSAWSNIGQMGMYVYMYLQAQQQRVHRRLRGSLVKDRAPCLYRVMHAM